MGWDGQLFFFCSVCFGSTLTVGCLLGDGSRLCCVYGLKERLSLKIETPHGDGRRYALVFRLFGSITMEAL